MVLLPLMRWCSLVTPIHLSIFSPLSGRQALALAVPMSCGLQGLSATRRLPGKEGLMKRSSSRGAGRARRASRGLVDVCGQGWLGECNDKEEWYMVVCITARGGRAYVWMYVCNRATVGWGREEQSADGMLTSVLGDLGVARCGLVVGRMRHCSGMISIAYFVSVRLQASVEGGEVLFASTLDGEEHGVGAHWLLHKQVGVRVEPQQQVEDSLLCFRKTETEQYRQERCVMGRRGEGGDQCYIKEWQGFLLTRIHQLALKHLQCSHRVFGQAFEDVTSCGLAWVAR